MHDMRLGLILYGVFEQQRRSDAMHALLRMTQSRSRARRVIVVEWGCNFPRAQGEKVTPKNSARKKVLAFFFFVC